ncbi:hypothetical protein [Algisphaera agarilytica]|uniref:Uncharacterized protein n=1 Tax=Algisphaera agarilytica TaxID=1385975 RepID=A0A7X0LN29_9BACT|nr:hypothetical protein [Algisphaera agarilytica]MBB6431598.1 hypothetical protein [Algisphaera agarilytica]
MNVTLLAQSPVVVSFAALFILLLVGILMAGFVMLVVTAIKRKNSTGLWVAVALFAMMFFVLPLGMVFLSVQRTATVQQHNAAYLQTESERQREAFREELTARPVPQPAVPLVAVEPPNISVAPTEWQPATEIMPDAEVDFYPSQREAEQAIAAAIVEAYGQPWRLPLTLIHSMEGPPTDTYQTAADAIRELGITARAVRPSVSNHTRQHGILLTLNPPTPESPIGMYHARDEHQTDAVPFAFSARFVDKPWLTDLSAYRITHDSPKLMMGFSLNPESTAEDAETAALRAVAAKLAPRVADQRGGSPSDYDSSILYPELDSIVRNLRRLNLVEDQFTQRLERSYGSVFRHAVLVDANPQVLKLLYQGGNFTWVDIPPQQQLAQAPRPSGTPPNGQPAYAAADYSPAPSAPMRPVIFSYVLRVLGLGVLVGITLLIYRVLDNWTLGYRQGALSVTVIAVILGGALLLGLLWMA